MKLFHTCVLVAFAFVALSSVASAKDKPAPEALVVLTTTTTTTTKTMTVDGGETTVTKTEVAESLPGAQYHLEHHKLDAKVAIKVAQAKRPSSSDGCTWYSPCVQAVAFNTEYYRTVAGGQGYDVRVRSQRQAPPQRRAEQGYTAGRYYQAGRQ